MPPSGLLAYHIFVADSAFCSHKTRQSSVYMCLRECIRKSEQFPSTGMTLFHSQFCPKKSNSVMCLSFFAYCAHF